MNVEVKKSMLSGTVYAPSSKSLSHRALIVAALARGASTLTNVLQADDIEQTIRGLSALGITIVKRKNSLTIKGGKLHAPKHPVYLGQSGTSLRFLTAVAGLVQGTTTLTGDTRLCERPMGDIFEPLITFGVSVRSIKNNSCAPIEIAGGKINGGELVIQGDVSSQFASALLLIAPLTLHKTTIYVRNALSKPYIDLTLKVMRDFGIEVISTDNTYIISPQQYTARAYAIEGDYSSSSYLFAAAAITGSTVAVKNLNPHSEQGDRYFLTLLEKMGCNVRFHSDAVTIIPAKNLRAISANLGDFPDIVQTLAVVAAFAQGTTKITNIAHLKHKETDRIRALRTELTTMGIQVKDTDNSLAITGGNPRGAQIHTHNDHRMAMSFTVAGLGASGTTVIHDAQAVNKSYPNFFKDLRTIGAQVKENL